jgi:putative acetyltransferase
MAVEISAERPDSPDAEQLILELEAHLAPRYPAESRHGFSVQRLLDEGVDFYVLRSDGRAAACGGVLLVPPTDGAVGYGEVKRMYVRPEFRGAGFGRAILERLADRARERGVSVLRLETGIQQVEAIGLYERAGFRTRGPFGPYVADPNNCYFEMRLA